MKIREGFAKRTIAGSNIVVPVGNAGKDFNGMITLNDSGSFFWDCMQSDTTVDEVVNKITEEYDVSRQQAKADLEKFISMLRQYNLICD